MAGKWFNAKFNSKCAACGGRIQRGEKIRFSRKPSAKCEHVDCGAIVPEAPTAKPAEFKISDRTPSAYQNAIFQDVLEGEGNRVINAVAGSGKTWTIVQALIRLVFSMGTEAKGEIALFLAFNRHIAKELQSKLATPHARISTAHSFGLSVLRDAWGNGFRVDAGKTRRILLGKIFAYNTLDPEAKRDVRKLIGPVCRLVSLAKSHLVMSPEALADALPGFMKKFDIQQPKSPHDLLGTVLETYKAVLNDKAIVDFDDMIFLPLYHDMPVPTFPYVFIDEAQDLNPAQQELARQAGENGRAFAVGDVNQAIYGFTGADTESIANLVTTLDAETLPLSICYRSGRKIVELAQALVPEIEAAPDAKEGEIGEIEREDFADEVQDGTLAICRTNAPLVGHALSLIKRGRKASIIGRSFDKELASLVSDVSNGRNLDVEEFLGNLDAYESMQLQALQRFGGNEMAQQAVQDKADTLRALAVGVRNTGAILARIEEIFSDDESEGVTFSSIHRAKGLENPTVFILRPDLLPHTLAKQDWQLEQEKHLEYVGYTRAGGRNEDGTQKDSHLVFVHGE